MKAIALISLPMLVVLLAAASVALAQEPIYTLTHWTLHSGATVSNHGYTLTGLIGQSEAAAVMSNQGYTLVGGFIPATQPFDPGDNPAGDGHQIYLPLIQLHE